MGSLLALDALLHLTRFCGVGNHADGVVVAHVFPQPVEQHHHLVFHAGASGIGIDVTKITLLP